MSVDTNAVHESIKLALDAADAATDVTTEYNRVKRDHRNLEASVKQIHRYTTIIFSFNRNCNSCNFTYFNIIFQIIIRVICYDKY